MSDTKELSVNGTTGLTFAELDEIQAYRDDGLPGIIEVTDQVFMAAFNMYLDGRSFKECAKNLGLQKIVIMHLAEKHNWFKHRVEYLDGYERYLKEQIVEEKIHSQYFIMKAMFVFRKRMGKKLDKYIRTDDESVGDTIDFKEMAIYNKMVETVANLDAKGIARDPSDKPAVGINLGDGVNMKKLPDGSVDITPRQKTVAEMMAELAKSKREQKDQEKK